MFYFTIHLKFGDDTIKLSCKQALKGHFSKSVDCYLGDDVIKTSISIDLN